MKLAETSPGSKTLFFHLIFTQPWAILLEHPCTWKNPRLSHCTLHTGMAQKVNPRLCEIRWESCVLFTFCRQENASLPPLILAIWEEPFGDSLYTSPPLLTLLSSACPCTSLCLPPFPSSGSLRGIHCPPHARTHSLRGTILFRRRRRGTSTFSSQQHQSRRAGALLFLLVPQLDRAGNTKANQSEWEC